MKAIHCREWGTPDTLRLEEAESPSLSPDEVRIRVRAAGINFADTLMIAGSYQVKPPFPFIPGLEAAGEVIELGSAVDALRLGQRVLAVLRFGGGYAEEIVLDAAAVVPIPDALRTIVEAFVAEHHVERPFYKRKRDRADPDAFARRAPARKERE